MGNRVLPVFLLAALAILVYVALRSGREAPSGEPGAAPEAPREEAPAAAGELPPIPDVPEVPAGPGFADLTVLVVDEANAPVVGARVTVSGRAAETGEDGTARLEGLSGGTKVPVRAAAGRTAIPATGTVDLVPDRHADLKLILVEGGGITGTVLGKGGAPLAGPYTVVVMQDAPGRTGGPFVVGGREVARQQFPAGTTSFSIDGVPAGTCLCRASSAGHVERASEAFEVVRGAITDGVVIQLDPGGRISGVVTRARTGEPVAGATVAASAAGATGLGNVFISGRRGTGVRIGSARSATTSAQGTFIIDGLEPGAYALSATAENLATGLAEGIEVREDGEAAGVLIALGEGGTITGRVCGADGQPVPRAEVLIGRIQRGLTIHGDFGDRVEANDDGVYTAEHLDPGFYRVSRPRAGRGTVAFAMTMVVTGGAETPPEEDEPPPGAVTVREGQVTRFDLTDPRSSSVRGRVLDESGRPHRDMVELRPVDPPEEAGGARIAMPIMEMPDDEGRFEFREVKPGRYTVACAGTEKEVAVAEGESAEVVLRVSPAKVEGVVLTSAGEPANGANVMLEPVGEVRAIPRGFASFRANAADKDGKFRIEGMAPGRYRVVARKGTGEGRSGEFSIGPGETVGGVNVTIEETIEIRVEVKDSAGNPVEGALVFLRPSESGVLGNRFGQTDREGVARVAAPPGEWTITVTKPGDPPRTAESRVTVSASPGQSFRVTL